MPNTPYQDWAKYTTPSADTILSANIPAGANYLSAATDCSAWPYCVVVFVNEDLAVTMEVGLSWQVYVGAVQQQLPDDVIVGPNSIAVWTRPVRGRAVQVSAAPVIGVTTAPAVYTVLGMSHRATQYDVRQDYTNLLDDTRAYGAGQIQTIPMNYWYEGPAGYSLFSDNGNAAWVEFQFFDRDNAWHGFSLVQVLARQNAVPRTVSFPPAPVRAVVTNQGAAQNIALKVIPSSTQ